MHVVIQVTFPVLPHHCVSRQITRLRLLRQVMWSHLLERCAAYVMLKADLANLLSECVFGMTPKVWTCSLAKQIVLVSSGCVPRLVQYFGFDMLCLHVQVCL